MGVYKLRCPYCPHVAPSGITMVEHLAIHQKAEKLTYAQAERIGYRLLAEAQARKRAKPKRPR